MRSKKQLGRYKRNKGARGEREICHLLGMVLGQPLRRKLGASRDGGSDIEIESYINSKTKVIHPGWSIEVKRGQRVALDKWWDQACTQATKEGREPLLVWRKNKENWQAFWIYQDNQVITDLETWVVYNYPWLEK